MCVCVCACVCVCVWACACMRAPEEGAEGTAPRLSVIGSVTIPCTWWLKYHSTTRRANAHVNFTAVSFWRFSYKEKLFKAEPGCSAYYVFLQFYLFVLNFIAPGTSGIGLIPKKAQCVSLRVITRWEKIPNKWCTLWSVCVVDGHWIVFSPSSKLVSRFKATGQAMCLILSAFHASPCFSGGTQGPLSLSCWFLSAP